MSWTKTVTAGGDLRTDFGYIQNTEHQLASITNTWNGGSNNYTNHTYGYDAVGRLETWIKDVLPSGSGNQWTMGYDASEHLETVAVTSRTGGQPTPVTADFHFYEYDAGGNRTSEQRSGAVRSWTADAFNQLTQQTAGGKMELRGNLNPQSKVTVTPVNTAGTPIGGAIAATAESGATQWKARTNVGEGVRRFSIRAEQTQAPQGLTTEVTTKTLQVNVPAESAVTFSYDADGNMTGNGIWTYKWDAENRLVSAKIPASTDGTEVTFSYDAFHRRVKVVETLGATTLSNKTLMWDGLDIVGQRENQTGELRVFHGNGETLKLNTSTVALLYTRDHLGSIRELVDAGTGAVRARYDYTPYGIRTKLTGDLEAEFGYTGHYTNARTGLVLAPYRVYSPELGRWISRDPIEEDGGINLYGYVEKGPLGAVDPLGLDNQGWPFNGVVNNHSSKTVVGFDADTWRFVLINPKSCSTSKQDIDAVFSDGKWWKIGVWNFDVGPNGEPDDGFDELTTTSEAYRKDAKFRGLVDGLLGFYQWVMTGCFFRGHSGERSSLPQKKRMRVR